MMHTLTGNDAATLTLNVGQQGVSGTDGGVPAFAV